jgi:lipopolysaccharide biosynthesis glycosyltransferase
MLKQQDLRDKGIYTREIDQEAATEFTFTRFLVPHLCDYKGWAIFVDCDFLFTHDIRELFQQIKDDIAVSVVQHDYVPTNTIKMDGKVQHQYPRKNWSSLMLFNCSHPDTQQLTAEVVNSESGAYLHRLEWTENIDSLDKAWNWLINWYHEPDDGTPKALHYTEGGPWFPNHEKSRLAPTAYLCLHQRAIYLLCLYSTF